MTVSSVDPNYVMPIEEKLELARQRGDAYAEMYEIAQGTAQAWKHRAEVLLAAVEFYSRHEHWMAITEDADCPLTNLVARKIPGRDGWAVAEEAMREVTIAASVAASAGERP